MINYTTNIQINYIVCVITLYCMCKKCKKSFLILKSDKLNTRVEYQVSVEYTGSKNKQTKNKKDDVFYVCLYFSVIFLEYTFTFSPLFLLALTYKMYLPNTYFNTISRVVTFTKKENTVSNQLTRSKYLIWQRLTSRMFRSILDSVHVELYLFVFLFFLLVL